ncbi:hypothetical protein EW146_g10351 [Bondarzewia mesenterica]|uniref:Uncharacterized protein n=1 Tax=Bondarzewia mesenterica TaxID=1095465 RepID=A0A4V6S141_9AGAM|nr:hypothetical protein EW146_g10351 [Bondarzewia mesenterica]
MTTPQAARRSGRLANRQWDLTPEPEPTVAPEPLPEPESKPAPAPTRRGRLTEEEKARRAAEKEEKIRIREQRAKQRQAEKEEKIRQKEAEKAERAEKAKQREAEKEKKARIAREKKAAKTRGSVPLPVSTQPSASTATTSTVQREIPLEVPLGLASKTRDPASLAKWTSIIPASSPSPSSPAVDQLRSTSPMLDHEVDASQTAVPALPPSSDIPFESTQEMTQEIFQTPLFFPGSSQFPTVASRRGGLPAASESEDEEPITRRPRVSARKLAVAPYRRLTQLASQDTLFSSPSPAPSHPLRAAGNKVKQPVEDDEDDDEESSASDSNSDAPQSYIPKHRQAGAATRARKRSGLFGRLRR